MRNNCIVETAFKNISKIKFEGPKSKNPLAFKHYNPAEIVGGKTLREHLRFSVVNWHTFRGTGSDPFGVGTAIRPWDDGTNSVANAENRAWVAFEFIEKLGAPFYAFHDRDVAPEGPTLRETNKNLDAVVKVLKAGQQRTGIKLLWGTANLFSNPRFVHGASTSCNADVFAFAGAQVKKALEVTHELGGASYVFWGGREGYSTLWNTNMKRELEHLAKFPHLAVDYKKKIGFKGQFYIEPKPKEPTKHQYDSDAAACLNFLREYDLRGDLKLNLETNHATLAGHSMQHELEVAGSAGALGSVDANTGNGQYTIVGVQSGKPLEVYGGLTANGSKVDLLSYSGGTGQTVDVPGAVKKSASFQGRTQANACVWPVSSKGRNRNQTEDESETFPIVSLPAWPRVRRASVDRSGPKPTRHSLLSRVAFARSQKDPAAAAKLVAEEISPGELQNEAAISVLHQWALRDTNATAAWAQLFPASDLHDRAMKEVENVMTAPVDN